MSINDHSLYLCGMWLKTSFLLPHLFCHVNFEIILLIEFENKTNWVLINAFWIRLRFVKYRFLRHRFIKYWFRFLSRPWINADVLVNILFLSKTSLRRLQDISSRCLQDVFSVTIFAFQDLFKMSSRRLQDVLKTYLQDVLKTS